MALDCSRQTLGSYEAVAHFKGPQQGHRQHHKVQISNCFRVVLFAFFFPLLELFRKRCPRSPARSLARLSCTERTNTFTQPKARPNLTPLSPSCWGNGATQRCSFGVCLHLILQKESINNAGKNETCVIRCRILHFKPQSMCILVSLFIRKKVSLQLVPMKRYQRNFILLGFWKLHTQETSSFGFPSLSTVF